MVYLIKLITSLEADGFYDIGISPIKIRNCQKFFLIEIYPQATIRPNWEIREILWLGKAVTEARLSYEDSIKALNAGFKLLN